MAVDTTTMSGTRVAINIPEPRLRQEMELPSSVELGDMIRPVVEFIRKQVDAEGKDTTWLSDTSARFHLAFPANMERIGDDETLGSAGVVNGTELCLVKRFYDRPFVPMQDDVAGGVAAVPVRKWENSDSQRIGLIFLSILFPGLALAGMVGGSGTSPLRVPVLALAGLTAVVCMAVATLLTRSDDDALHPVGKVLVSSAYCAAACAAWSAIPRDPGLYHLLVLVATLIGCSVLFRVFVPQPSWLHQAVLTPSVIAGLVLAVNLRWHQEPSAIAAQVAAVEVAALMVAHKLALMFGGIEHPSVPATGDSLVSRSGPDSFNIVEAARSTIKGALASILSQYERTSETHRIRYGIVGGMCAYAVVALAALGHTNRDQNWSAWVLAALISTVLIIRGRSDGHWVAAGVQLSAAVIGWVGFLLALATSPMFELLHESLAQQLAAGIGALTVVVIVSTVWAVQRRTLLSLPTLQFIQWMESAVIVAMLVDTFLYSGGWSAIRHR